MNFARRLRRAARPIVSPLATLIYLLQFHRYAVFSAVVPSVRSTGAVSFQIHSIGNANVLQARPDRAFRPLDEIPGRRITGPRLFDAKMMCNKTLGYATTMM